MRRALVGDSCRNRDDGVRTEMPLAVPSLNHRPTDTDRMGRADETTSVVLRIRVEDDRLNSPPPTAVKLDPNDK